MTDKQQQNAPMVRVHMLSRSGHIVTVDGDSWRWGLDSGTLLVERGDELVAEFAPGTWSHVEKITLRAGAVYGTCVSAQDATGPDALHAVTAI